MQKSDIGIFGLGVMGRNLALNFEEADITVSGYNRDDAEETEQITSFMTQESRGIKISLFTDLQKFISSLKQPRTILLMVKAGQPVDGSLSSLIPLLSSGDIIIDGGNSYFRDTERRIDSLKNAGIHFIGAGISGGEMGARHGASIMAGGSPDAWKHAERFLAAAAARAPDGRSCCALVGPGASGHFVKMTHNGIEYGIMQLIAEVYHLIRGRIGLSPEEIADIFAEWNSGLLRSYLLGITSDILRVSDNNGSPLIDVIGDRARDKGTGRRAVSSALELSVPVPTISAAVTARFLSSLEKKREAYHKTFPARAEKMTSGKELISITHSALRAAFIICFEQGFSLISAASREYDWDISLPRVARIWQGGCIISSTLLKDIEHALDATPSEGTFLNVSNIETIIKTDLPHLRRVVKEGIHAGQPIPALASTLTYFDSLASGHLPTNLIQAQRDYFGAHTYERVDSPEGDLFHTDWESRKK